MRGNLASCMHRRRPLSLDIFGNSPPNRGLVMAYRSFPRDRSTLIWDIQRIPDGRLDCRSCVVGEGYHRTMDAAFAAFYRGDMEEGNRLGRIGEALLTEKQRAQVTSGIEAVEFYGGTEAACELAVEVDRRLGSWEEVEALITQRRTM